MRAYTTKDPILDSKVDMAIVPQITGRIKHARRGQKSLPAGSTVYCISYKHHNGFFTYCYLNKDDAIKVMNIMKLEGTDTLRYMQFNFASNVDYCMHVE